VRATLSRHVSRWRGPRALRPLMMGLVVLILIMFAVNYPAGLPGWRFSAVVSALVALLSLNLFLAEPIAGASVRVRAWQDHAFLVLSALLVLVAFWLSGQPSVLYLLSLVCAQAAFRRGVWPFGAVFGASILATVLVLQVVSGSALPTIAGTETALAAGIVAVLLLVTLLKRSARQTERAEGLLRELQEANREVEASHQREKELVVTEERLRLARELHDSVTQELYSAMLFAQAAMDQLSSGDAETAAGHIRETRDSAHQALREMRLLVFELHRPALEAKGLAAAVQARLDAVEARSGTHAELRVEGDPNVGPEASAELYRIVHEALNNVLKHAKAGEVRVMLAFSREAAVAEVRDDGIGFAAGGRGQGGGFGIPGMRERAAKMGGTLRIESEPGKGTRVIAEVPVTKGG
jgi:signal transduction histidine kinase